MTYQAPVDDIMLALKSAAGLDELTASGIYDGLDADTIRAVVEEAGRFASNVLEPLNAPGDKTGSKLANGEVTTPPGWRAAYKGFIEGGWTALPCEEKWGGQGLPNIVVDGGQRDLERGEPRLRPVPDAEPGRHRGDCDARLQGAAGHLHPQAGDRRVDRHDEPDRAARRHRPRPVAHARRAAAGRQLSPLRHQDLHHLRRARPDREHRAHGARPHRRRAGRHARHLAVRGAEAAGQQGRLAGRAQRRRVRRPRAQARHPRQPDLRDEVRRERRRHRLSRRRGEPRPQRHVHHDERGTPRRRRAGRRARRPRLAARDPVRPGPPPGPQRQDAGHRHGTDHRARRHPPLAAHHARDDAGRPRDLPRHRGADRPVASRQDGGGPREGQPR